MREGAIGMHKYVGSRVVVAMLWGVRECRPKSLPTMPAVTKVPSGLLGKVIPLAILLYIPR
jgi:hypothetical protein